LEKIIKKSYGGKHYNNSQCFKEKKLQSYILNQLNIKKIQSTETILEEKNNKKNTKKKEKK